jgi:predicted 3-demethylubiquinone-9 3-methyltransferase (glyoxalase superfamily)
MANTLQKITPNLWFDNEAEEAANFYVSIFKNSKIGGITRYGPSAAAMSGKPVGSVLTVTFELEGQEFTALNGGPQFKFTEAISLGVNCDTQQEVDELWTKLTESGEPGPCGWLKDRYGVSWQVVPRILYEMMLDQDTEKAERVMTAILQMQKLEIVVLQEAYEGRSI